MPVKAKLFGLLLTFGLFGAAANAAEPSSNTWILTINHHKASYSLRAEGADPRRFERSLGDLVPIDLSTDETLVIQIEDPNPFYYEYSWKEGTATPTANFKAIDTLSNALASFDSSLAKLETASAAASSTNAIAKVVLEESNRPNRGSSASLTELYAAVPSRDQANINSRLSAAIDLENLKKLRDAIADLSRCVDALPSLIVRLDQGTATPAQLVEELLPVSAKRRLVETQLETLEKAIDKAFEDLTTTQVIEAIIALLVQNSFVEHYRPDVKTAFDQLESVQQGLEKARELARNPLGKVGYDPYNSKPFEFTVKRAATLAKSVEPGRFIKTIPFELKPYSSFVLGIGAGAVYSFVKRPEFEAKAKGDQFEIVRKRGEDHVGFNLAALLTITPRRWNQSDFHPLFEIGIKPDTDNLGLYAGVAVAYSKRFGLGVGVAFEQVEDLADGFDVGQLLSTAEELKTEKRFKAGAYLHLTVKMDVGAGAK